MSQRGKSKTKDLGIKEVEEHTQLQGRPLSMNAVSSPAEDTSVQLALAYRQ